MKWEPPAAMIVLLLLGIWVVYGPKTPHTLRAGAETIKFDLAGKGELEILRETSVPDAVAPNAYSFRLLYRGVKPGSPINVIPGDEFIRIFGRETYDRAVTHAGNQLFRALNISSWTGVAWVLLGFAGQGAFVGRMFIQWLVSERQKRSVVPEVFWWLSLAGGVMTFAYFVWRQDVVGVLGQTSGVVIYARNIRLIHKQQRRAARDAQSPPP